MNTRPALEMTDLVVQSPGQISTSINGETILMDMQKGTVSPSIPGVHHLGGCGNTDTHRILARTADQGLYRTAGSHSLQCN